MPRVKRGPKRKNKRAKVMDLASGYWGMKSRGYRIAKQQVQKALRHAIEPLALPMNDPERPEQHSVLERDRSKPPL